MSNTKKVLKSEEELLKDTVNKMYNKGSQDTDEAKEDNEKYFRVKDLIDFLTAYKNKEKTEEDYKKLLKGLNIKNYLKLYDKVDIMLKVCIEMRNLMSNFPEIKTVGLELYSIFDVLLSYTNVNLDNVEEIMDYETYDLLMETGLVRDIKKVCEEDYNVLLKLINNTLNFENIGNLFDVLGNQDTTSMLEAIKESNSFLKDFPEDKMKQLLEIASIK